MAMELPKKKAEEGEPSSFGLARIFKYEELEKATNSFHTELGVGGYGRVYLGALPDGREVAVKILFDDPKRLQQFFNEIAVLPRLRHKNLITLYGFTSPLSQRFCLVYDYVPNGTVFEHLHGQRSDLTLALRIQIAVETAEALSYLHALEPPIIHRDVKTSNILLDNGLHVKVADLGICRHMPWDTTQVSTLPQGTLGYRDPEYDHTFLLSDKSDGYSLGVVLMELMSGLQAVDVERGFEDVYLGSLALKKILSNKLEEFVDPKLGYHSNPDVKRVINGVAKLAHACLHPNGRMRPSMVQVLSTLKEIQTKMLEMEQNVVDVMSSVPQRGLGYGNLNNGFTFYEIANAQACRFKVACCRFSSDGKLLAIFGHDKKVALWCTNTLEWKYTLEEHSLLISDVRFSPCMPRLATSSFDRNVRVWDVDNCRCGLQLEYFEDRRDDRTRLFRLQGHRKHVQYVCWDRSGDYVASVSEDSVRVWSLRSGSEGECVHELSCYGNKFRSCVFHPTYPSVLVIGCDQSLELWDMTQKKTVTLNGARWPDCVFDGIKCHWIGRFCKP